MAALRVAWNQFLKNSDKLPGWTPLLVLVLAVLAWIRLPIHVRVFGRDMPVSMEVIAGVITFAFYALGDALDEPIFKKRIDGKVSTRPLFKKIYADASSSAQRILRVDEAGLYSLAAKLTRVAEKDRQTVLINLPNESAKFLRSLIVPLLVFGVYCIFQQKFILGVIGIIGGGLSIVCYPKLKARHIRRLYASAAALEGPRLARLEVSNLTFLFWDGKFVDAGIHSVKSQGAVHSQNLSV